MTNPNQKRRWPIIAATFIIGLTSALVLNTATAASAGSIRATSPQWSISKSFPAYGQFSSVSCSSATDCVAVDTTTWPDVPFVELWPPSLEQRMVARSGQPNLRPQVLLR